MSRNYSREIDIILAVRAQRESLIAKARRRGAAEYDGDKDGYRTGPNGKDNVPYTRKTIAAARRAAGKAAGSAKPRQNRVLQTGASKAEPAKAAAKRPKKNRTPVRLPERVTRENYRSVISMPIFSTLTREVEVGRGDDFAEWERMHRRRIAEGKTAFGEMKSGGKSHLFLMVPADQRGDLPPGTVMPPGGEYIAGAVATPNDTGMMGESLVQENPTVRRIIERFFGAKLSQSEGMNLDEGRVSNSTFDFYAGQYGIEVKTIGISGSKDGFKMNDFIKKVDNGKAKGVKAAAIYIFIDQREGRIFIFGAKDRQVKPGGKHSYSQMSMLTPPEGLPIGQDALYAAWLYGTLNRPNREGGSGTSFKYDRAKKKVVITGKASKTQFGSELKNKTASQRLSEKPSETQNPTRVFKCDTDGGRR